MGIRSALHRISAFVVCSLFLMALFSQAACFFARAAGVLDGISGDGAKPSASPPTVDPKTSRQFLFSGDARIGIWLNSFDDEGNCTGNVYAVFNASKPFHQFGFPTVWSGTPSNGTDVTVEFSLYSFIENEGATLLGEPLFTDTQHISRDNGYGIVIPLLRFFPAGQYVFSVRQLTGRFGDAAPYLVLPEADPVYPSNYVRFGGCGDKTPALYIDFLDDGGSECLSPLIGYAGEPIAIIENDSLSSPHLISGGDEFAMLSPVIPENTILRRFIFSSAPTWGNNGPGSELSFSVYEWKEDYASSVSGEVLYSGIVTDHKDNEKLTLDLGTALRGGKRYLIVTRSEGTEKIGFWQGDVRLDGDAPWIFFENGVESDLTPTCAYVPADCSPLEYPSDEDGSPSASPDCEASETDGDTLSTPSGSQRGKSCGSALQSAGAVLFLSVFSFLLTVGKKSFPQ